MAAAAPTPAAPPVSNMVACVNFIAERVTASLESPAKAKSARFMASLNEDANRIVTEEWIKEPDQPFLIFFWAGPDKVTAATTIPRSMGKKKGVYFLKSKNVVDSLKIDDLKTEVVCSELTEQGLSNLALLAQEVYYPLLSNPANRSGWSGPTSKELMLKFSNFLSKLTMTVGQSKGQTLLPNPPPEAFDEENIPDRERIYLLETAVVEWTDKIKEVLTADPETLSKLGGFPDPLVEIEFWAAKASDLTSLSEQLNSDRIRLVRDQLLEIKNAYGTELESLTAKVAEAREEAADNTKFLRTLKASFRTLRNELDFLKLESIFTPMLHTMLLVWQHSHHYNKRARLVTLVQEICNGLIAQAQKHCQQKKIFEVIELGDVDEAIKLVTKTIAVCEKFKATFFIYAEKAAKLLPEGAWDVPKEILFVRLDAFLERCQDVLEFVKIVMEFSRLEKIFIGGTKGKALTEMLHILHADFQRSYEQFQPQRLPYDIMDITVTQFDDDFYQYRCQVKEMERRLAAVVIQAFDDSSTMTQRFKLLDAFEGLLERPIVKDELDKRQNMLLTTYNADLMACQALFLEGTTTSGPKIDSNLPPTAGSLAWCRGLLDRVREPFHKLRHFVVGGSGGHRDTMTGGFGMGGVAHSRHGSLSFDNKETKVGDTDELVDGKVTRIEMKEVERLHDAIVKQLEDYEKKKIGDWAKEIDATSEDKLLLPLLRRESKDSRRLVVNFDDALVRLLREVKYFLQLRLAVPPTAVKIYQKGDKYRQQMGTLDMMVKMYNEMMDTLHPVERPLVEKDVAHIDDTLERGITALNWTMTDAVDAFIKEAMDTVKEVYATVKVMKDNLGAIRKMMEEYASQPLAERKNKPLSPSDFEDNLKKLWAARHLVIAENQKKVTELLNQTLTQLKVNKGSPIWRAYVEYVQDQVRDGLALTITNSIKFLCDQLADQQSMEKNGMSTLLEIKIGLYANEVLFNAEDVQPSTNLLGATPAAGTATAGGEEKAVALAVAAATMVSAPRKSRRDVWQIVADWAEAMFEIGNIMTRMDGSHYVGDLKKNEPIMRYINVLKKLLDGNQRECELYRAEYTKYDFLWKTDRNTEFNRFLQTARAQAADERKRADEKEEEKKRGKKLGGNVPPPSAGGDKKGDAKDAKTPRTARGGGDDDDSDMKDDEDPNAAAADILPLDKFEAKIVSLRELAKEINAKPASQEIGWLKVNALPIKESLKTWVARWIKTYTDYLYNDVTHKLNDMEQLQKEVNENITDDVQGDSVRLKKVLGYIHKVKSADKSTKKMFGPMRECVALLKKYGRNLSEPELRLLAEAQRKWDETVDKVYQVKETVNSLQNEEVSNIRQKVTSFDTELKAFRKDFRNHAPFSYDLEVDEAYDLIMDFHRKINKMEEKSARLNDLEKVFELTVSKHVQIKKSRHENKLLKQVWDMVSIVKHQFDDWKKTLWDKIDADSLELNCNKLLLQMEEMSTEIRSWAVFLGLQADVKNFKTVAPLVTRLRSDAMEERHWRDLKALTGKQFNKDASFCLANLLELELHKYVSDVEYIVDQAQKEAKIGAQLRQIEANWSNFRLEFGTRTQSIIGDIGMGGESKGPLPPTMRPSGSAATLEVRETIVGTIRRPDEILTKLEENQAALQGIQGQGKTVDYFIDDVKKWQKILGTTETVLYDWLEVQSKWSALQAIFMGSQDIRIQLPVDAQRFMDIDAKWKELMTIAKETPNVIEACVWKGRSELLGTMKIGLEQCEKSLNQYLETKRKAFPRFYFLPNTALLDILSNGHDPQKVQRYLGDCFDNINALEFKENADGVPTKTAIKMVAKEGDEKVDFYQPLECKGAVEDWLNQLVVTMRETLSDILGRAKYTADHWEPMGGQPRHKWLFQYPAQIALTASQIIWSEEINSQFEAFQDGNEQAMKEEAKTLQTRLDNLIQLVLGTLTAGERTKVITMITVDVHNLAIVQKLIEQKVYDPNSFLWQSQMRFKWKGEARDCQIRIADAQFSYSYEYIGNTSRLVITPLTDRCYITLTQALRLIMGGAPAGPAGTGKTETTKDLGRALGLPVYVFNCSELMNVQYLSAVFRGICQTGAWACFDEFNRIQVEVLSVVSMQVACLLNAQREKREEFDFQGEMIKLVPSAGVFITMNPGYAGRTQLPENLKALFRSCAMVVPDMELICENMLMSEGFLLGNKLSKKFTTLYSLSSELLSKQIHYDWGLRATKSVLVVAGSLKRGEPSSVPEERILMRALRDFNIPKLVDEDKPIFRQLIEDLFPGHAHAERKVDPRLQEAIQLMARQGARPDPTGRDELDGYPESKWKLQAEDTFVLKCVELAELLEIRHSVFIIGPAGSGKSEIWKTLVSAFRHMGRDTVYEVVNPKAVNNSELFGYLSKTDWHDGILSTVMRNMSRNNPPYTPAQKYKWVVLDGDIDPDWIESLNSVMDDNKMLTLVSNERIPLAKEMRLVFEIDNLANATPATVSRAGIIFINAKDIGWKPFHESWIESRKDEKEKSFLLSLFNRYVESLADIRGSFKTIVPVSEINIIRTLCYLLEGLLAKQAELKKKGKPEDRPEPAMEKDVFEANFVFAVIWALGGALMADKQHPYRNEFSERWKDVPSPIKFPKEGTVFDYYPNPKTGKMVPWASVVPPYEPPQDAHLVTKAFVPTVDTVRMRYLLDLLVSQGKPVLLVGSAGTGKTTLVQEFLGGLGDGFMHTTINLNYYTNPKTLQRIMEGNIDKRVGRTYGPAGHKKLIYYIDDLNMPRLDKYGTQTPLALIRQHMDYGSWYDTAKLEKKEIQDVQYVASMNPTAGSFTINERLQGKFATFAVLLPSQADLHAIYGAVMDHHFGQGAGAYPKDVLAMKDLLVKATVEVLDAIVTSPQFRPDSKRFHYLFNLRDLSSIFQGLCQIQPGKGFDPKTIVRLWEHECTRTFADRLVKKQEVAKFDELLTIKTKNFFGGSVKLETKSIDDNRELKAGERDDGPLLFTSFMTGRAYLPVGSMDKLRRVLQTRLKEYNATLPVMNLELFGVAMEHVCRIVRIIENPRGNALLVGVGGSGKQSLARLASFICGYSTFQISVTQTYGVQQLKEDLQTLYRKAGEKNMPVCFLLTESQIIDDEWLVYVNDLLASGHIPDLFTPEEKDGIFAHIRNEARQFGVPDTREAMHDFFIGRVRTNLHMILCFSPVPREAFRVRCRKFPGLINCTTMDWFHPWPRDALVSVASRFLSEIDVGDVNTSMAISEFLASTHLSVNQASVQYKAVERRYNYTTPKSFLALIEFFKTFLAKKRTDLTKQIDRLEKGILTLKQTHSKVADLKEELDKARERAREKGDKVAETLTQLNLQQKKVTDEQQKAAVEAGNAKRASDAATIIREECDKELAAAMPLLEKAKDAVNCLDKASLNEMRTLGSPPPPVVAVARAVMTLINYPDKKRDWNCAKTKLLAVTERFIDDLRVFDATKIDEVTMKKMDEFLGEPWFSVEGFTASRAGANLCGWVVNICAYNRIYQRTKPKMENQAKANADYESAHARLMAAEAKVEEKQKQLRAKQAELDAANAEKKQLDDEAKNCDDRLTLAKRLVVGLAEENTRWTKGVSELKEKGRTMTGDVLLASAFVSYVGAFSQVFRRQLVDKKWIPDLIERKIPLTAGVDPLRVLATLSDFAKWKNEDLADDPMSLQNAAIITQCTRWPLFIDPQLQGIKWLRKRIRGIKTVQLSQKRWLSVLRDAIINGDVVLIENLGEELDATLEPVLARSTVQRGPEKFIKVGSDEVVYNDNFKLFLQTKLANPHYKPEVAAQCTIVNFIVTEEGLEEQLLEKVVNKEKPDLEEKRGHAVHAINEYMVNLVDLENDLLERLSNAPPDILGDEELIIGLENTKKTATDIEAKVASLRVQEVSINASRNDFRPVAAEGSWLYFLLSQLNSIDHMYQYSLDAFSGFFIKAMARAKKADNVKERVVNLRESIRYTVFTWVNRGLFEKHKLIFSSQLCFKLMAKDALKEKLNPAHFEFLIRGEPKKGGPEKPLEWLPSTAWWQIQRLIELDGFQKLASDMVASPNRFKEWYNKPRPESSPLPLEWRKLDESNPFMKLLIVKAMRLDRMTTAMENYVRDALPNGKSYTEVDAGRGFVEILSAALDDSTKVNPIFFILSPGADPIHNVEFLAKRNGFSEGKFHRVAMGQGQETNALNRLDIASKEGHWVVLENIHLMPKWVFELEKKLDEFESAAATGGSHEDFRVFLSAEPSETIPIGLLERSIKLTNEPPQGLKQNLKRAFNTFDKDDFEFKDPKMKSIIFGLCHFHSIIIERIKFGAKGWNRVYPFGTGDLMCSVIVLSNYLENATGDKIPWNDLKYIFGEIIYGGHITDDWDRLLCATYLRWYMREDLLDEMELYPFNESTPEEKFRSPPPLPYDQYNDYIESQMQPESPIAFGLHPNAEISVKTKQAEELFHRIVDLQPRSGVAASESKAQTQRVIGLVSQIRERTKPIRYAMDELATQCIGPDDRRGSYQNVFLQECDRMNRLVEEIQRSLNELDQGLSGELQISEKMVALHQALDLGRVPATWTKLAYPSERALGAWVDNLISRADQLNNWVSDPVRVPPWVNLAFLFNPQSFLTAIMQETAQEQKLELDKLVIATEVTRKTTDQISESRPKDGSAYVTGLYLEGARWNWTTGQLEECNPRELFSPLPVMVCRAIPVDKQEKGGQYRCPVYKTQSRGATYVFTANLRSPKLPASKWILAGVALVMEVEDI